MRSYEAFLVFVPEASADVREKQVAEVEGLIKKFGGKVAQKNDLGKKSLGYFRKKNREGYCLLYDIQLDPSNVLSIRKALELQSDVIHYLWTIKVEVPEKKARKKPASKSTRPSQGTSKPKESHSKQPTAGAK